METIGIIGSNKLLLKLHKDIIDLGFKTSFSDELSEIKSIVVYHDNDLHSYRFNKPSADELITVTESNYTEVLTKLKQRL